MTDTVVSDAIQFPQDEGLSASIADGHETYPGAGYLGGLAEAAGTDAFVQHGLGFTNHDGTADEVDVAAGRAFVRVSSVDVQTGLGGSTAPSYDATLSNPIFLMLDLPTGAADLGVSSGTLNPVWLAFATDGSVSNIEVEDIYLRHGSNETAPPHPSVKLGETNPDNPSADTLANRGPAFDEATILDVLTDAAGVDHTGELADAVDVSSIQSSGDVDHDATSNRTHSGDTITPDKVDTPLVDTESLVIGGTLYEEDENSPVSISGKSAHQYSVSGDYDEILIIPDPTGGTGFNELRVNGDTNANYDYVDNSDTKYSGQSVFAVPFTGTRLWWLTIRDTGNIRLGVAPATAATGQTVGGENTNLGGNGVNTFTVVDSNSTARDWTARVYGRSI